jgi:N-acetylglutamate synthase-like GNAT family acetyltransferase
MSVIAWFKRIWTDPARFVPLIAAERIPPAVVRPLIRNDVDSCCEIFKLNQPNHFPDGFLPEFLETLHSETHLYLVAETAGEIVGVGGIYLNPELWGSSSLVFGLVHPNWHRQGFGSTLLLARLSVLPKPAPRTWVYLSSGGTSDDYFKRFGFEHYGRLPIPPSLHYFDCYRSFLGEAEWNECSDILARRGVRFDRRGIVVPKGPAIPNKSLERRRDG